MFVVVCCLSLESFGRHLPCTVLWETPADYSEEKKQSLVGARQFNRTISFTQCRVCLPFTPPFCQCCLSASLSFFFKNPSLSWVAFIALWNADLSTFTTS